jgi:hypothetical protein
MDRHKLHKNWDLLEHPPKNEHKWTIDSPVLVEQILPGDHQEILDTTHPMTIPYLDITQPHFMCPNLCKSRTSMTSVAKYFASWPKALIYILMAVSSSQRRQC